MQIDEERWRRIEAIFNDALELHPSQRTTFLAEACSTDVELRKEVQELLRSSEKTAKLLAEPIEGVVQDLVSAEALVGRTVGHYKIIRTLGEGGMGKVYLAERSDQEYQTKVAIKTISTFLGSQNRMLERFRSERQILANLQHANIARLLDGGVTSEGLPYLVMEYVDGEPIHDYCLRHSLRLKDRLCLFGKVCSAIEYAHHHLVIHRDIKPANILVDAAGEPRLLDFGIAKLIEQVPDTASPVLASATECLMTPEYASPEQIRGEPVSTATDIYALGVLLYELLTGQRPYQFETHSHLEMARVICQKEPTAPSAVVKARRTDSSTENPGTDLDNIVLMAMRKNPTERYASVATFWADIQAYLNGYPVLARQQSWSYRAAKFIKRHKVGFSAAVISVVALIGFSIGMGILARRANQEQKKAQKEAEFLASMFRAASPDEAKGREITARELLDRGAERINIELAAEPEIRMPLVVDMAQAYSDLGAYDKGLALLNRSSSVSLLNKLTFAQQAEAFETEGTLYRLKSNYKAAEPLFRRALALRRNTLRASDPLIAQSLTTLGECLYLQQQDLEAESLLREALRIRRSSPPDNADDVRNYLALLLKRKGEFNEAVELLSEAVAISLRVGGTDSPSYGQSLHNWASALIDVGDLGQAETRLRELLDVRRRVLGRTHPAITYTLNNLGFVLLEEGKPSAAEPYLKENLQLRLQVYGRENPGVISGWNNWARFLHATGQFEEARKSYQRALDIALKEGPETWTVAQIKANLGRLAFDQKDHKQAEDLEEEALSVRRKLGGPEKPVIATSLLDLAIIRLYLGDAAGAESLCRQAVAIREKALTGDNPAILQAKLRLAETLMVSRRFKEANGELEWAVHYVHRPPFVLPSWQTAEAEADYAFCESALHVPKAPRRSRTSDLVNDPQWAFRKPPEIWLTELSDRVRSDGFSASRVSLRSSR